MKMKNVTSKLKGLFGKTKFILKKHSPEIFMAAGIGGTIVSTVMACCETTKINSVLDPAKEDLSKIRNAEDEGSFNGEEYTETDAGRDFVIVYARTGLNLVKLYYPSIIAGALSLTSILASNNILRKRAVALASAYAALDTGFKEYRERVVDKYGEDQDRAFLYGTEKKKITEKVVDENGKEKKVKKEIEVVDPDKEYSQYAMFFDSRSPYWSKNPKTNKDFLKCQEAYANDRLLAQGYLFKNDVCDMLGLPRTKDGQVVGWRYYKNPEDNKYGDNYVSFGIHELNVENDRFLNGYEPVALLDFNVDGDILDNFETAENDKGVSLRRYQFAKREIASEDGEGDDYYDD